MTTTDTHSTETCHRHGLDFPVWLACPKCQQEANRLAHAAYESRVRWEGEANLLSWQEPEIVQPEEVNWNLWLAKAVFVTFILTAIMGFWMQAHNRQMDREIKQIEREARTR